MKLWRMVAVFGAVLGSACAGVLRVREGSASLQEAIRVAELRGVGKDPRAADELRYAREQLDAAESYVQTGDLDHAEGLLERARADVELAVALEEEGRAKAEAEGLQATLDHSSGRGGER